jgi:hypothetical protein
MLREFSKLYIPKIAWGAFADPSHGRISFCFVHFFFFHFLGFETVQHAAVKRKKL